MSALLLLALAGALVASKMDRAALRWRDEYLCRIPFSRAEWGVSGEFFLAPRIQSDDFERRQS